MRSKVLLTLAEVCFVLVAVGALLSIIGLIDAYLAANFIVFDFLSQIQPLALVAIISLVATVGFVAILLAKQFGAADVDESAQMQVSFAANVNHQLDAERLQAMLHVLQYPVKIDGIFGPDTEKAVGDFQTDLGLAGDGVVDPLTLEALQKEVDAHGRGEWVGEILYGHRAKPTLPASRSAAPILSLISARRS
ncbi:MAG: peptidoglycan-binding domain-containing protein [Alphaproteobacteria bacterium]|nr:peptidoglycan-binding domain-containing protein [Alphaproteobacteria bacterium]